MKDKKRAFKPYLSRRHVFKWYVSICQLTGCYPYAVNVGFRIVTLEILDEKEKKKSALWTYMRLHGQYPWFDMQKSKPKWLEQK